MEMLAEVRERGETDDKLKGKRGEDEDRMKEDEGDTQKEKRGIQTSSVEVSLSSSAVVLSVSQAATGRQAKNILSLKVLTAPLCPPSYSLSLSCHSFPACSRPCTMNPRLHRHCKN